MNEEYLKPLDLGSIIDKSFRLTFSNMTKNFLIFIIYLGISIVSLIIIAAFLIFIVSTNRIDMDILNFRNLYSLFDSVNYRDTFMSLYNVFLAFIPVLVIFAIFLFVVQIFYLGMLNDIFIKSITGEQWNFKTSFHFVRSKFFVLAGANILGFFILIAGTLFFCVGAIPASIIVAFIFPAVLFENEKTAGSISRSFKLVFYDFWPCVGYFIVLSLIIGAISFVFDLFTNFLSGFISGFMKTTDSIDLYVTAISASFIILILKTPLTIFTEAIQRAFFNLLFFNMKIKHENYGIEMLALSISDNMESKPPEQS